MGAGSNALNRLFEQVLTGFGLRFKVGVQAAHSARLGERPIRAGYNRQEARYEPIRSRINEWVGEGTHLIAVGSCLPTQRELDPALVARARLIVDSRAAALKEAGDVLMGIAEGRWMADHIEAELGERPMRRDDRQVTVFKSLGLAVEDLFAAHLVLTAASRASTAYKPTGLDS